MDFWRENSNIFKKKINVARFARKIIKWEFLRDFQTLADKKFSIEKIVKKFENYHEMLNGEWECSRIK